MLAFPSILAIGGIQTELIYKSIVYGGMIPAETPPPSNRHADALLVGKHGDSLIGNFIGSVTSPWGTFKHFFVRFFSPKEGCIFLDFSPQKASYKIAQAVLLVVILNPFFLDCRPCVH